LNFGNGACFLFVVWLDEQQEMELLIIVISANGHESLEQIKDAALLLNQYPLIKKRCTTVRALGFSCGRKNNNSY